MSDQYNPKLGYTFLLAMPHSGGELLMRMMGVACLTNITGDLSPTLIGGLLDVYDSLKEDKVKGWPPDLEKKGLLNSKYSRELSQFEGAVSYYHIKQLLFNSSGKQGFGWSSRLDETQAERLVTMLRDIGDSRDDLKIKIVFLVREPDRVLLMDQNKNGILMDTYKELYELGDHWISYEGFRNDPKGVLLKMNPARYPDEKKIKEIIG